MDANEIATVRSRYMGLADRYRRADGSLPDDIREGLRWVASLERRWCLENPGCR